MSSVAGLFWHQHVEPLGFTLIIIVVFFFSLLLEVWFDVRVYALCLAFGF